MTDATTDATKTEREGLYCWTKPAWGFTASLAVSGRLGGPEAATIDDVVACLSANPELRAAVLEGIGLPPEQRLRDAITSELREKLRAAESELAEAKADNLATHDALDLLASREDAAKAALASELAAERARVVAAEAMVEDARKLASRVINMMAGNSELRDAARAILASHPAPPATVEQAKDSRPATEAAPHCEGCHEWGCPGLVGASDSNPFPHIRRLTEVMAQPAPIGAEERVSEPWRYADGGGDSPAEPKEQHGQALEAGDDAAHDGSTEVVEALRPARVRRSTVPVESVEVGQPDYECGQLARIEVNGFPICAHHFEEYEREGLIECVGLIADQPAATETTPSGHAMACGCARCIERRGRHEDWLGITPSGVPIMAETAPQGALECDNSCASGRPCPAPQGAPESQQSDD